MERALTSSKPNLPADLHLRRPTEADHARLARLVPEWWGERRPTLPRLWLRHFAATSVVVDTGEGRTVGAAIAFLGHDDPSLGVVLVVAVAPSRRRHGVGRALVATVEAALRDVGAKRVEAVLWPGNRTGVRFLESLAYSPVPESLATPLFGVPALADYDGDGEDRAVFVRELPAG